METTENNPREAIVVPFPSPSVPPAEIYPEASAIDVRLYVYKRLRDAEPGFNEETGWRCACKVVGNGRQVLEYSEEQWIRMLGIYGAMIFNDIEGTKKYGKVSNIYKFMKCTNKSI